MTEFYLVLKLKPNRRNEYVKKKAQAIQYHSSRYLKDTVFEILENEYNVRIEETADGEIIVK